MIDVERVVFAGILLVAFVIGVRSTYRLVRKVRVIPPTIDKTLAQGAVIIALIVTLTALYFGSLAIWALLGNPRPAWAPFTNSLVVAGIMLIPYMIDWGWDLAASRISNRGDLSADDLDDRRADA